MDVGKMPQILLSASGQTLQNINACEWWNILVEL